MDAVASLREQFKVAHGMLEGTMADVTADQAQWSPPGRANPLGASYAHTVLGEDVMVNGLVKGGAPMFVTSWAGKAGVSEPPPMPDLTKFHNALTCQNSFQQAGEKGRFLGRNGEQMLGEVCAGHALQSTRRIRGSARERLREFGRLVRARHLRELIAEGQVSLFFDGLLELCEIGGRRVMGLVFLERHRHAIGNHLLKLLRCNLHVQNSFIFRE